MSIAFGIALEDETWIPSPEYSPSQNLPLSGVWEMLEAIADEKGLTQLSYFVVEDPDLYEEALDAINELDEFEHNDSRQIIQAKLEGLSEHPGWFNASDAGIAKRTIQALIEHMRNHPDLLPHYGDQAVTTIIAELEGFSIVLSQIELGNIRFKLWME